LGRIYDARIKKLGDEILNKYQNQLTTEFHENKRIISGKMNTRSKFIINKHLPDKTGQNGCHHHGND